MVLERYWLHWSKATEEERAMIGGSGLIDGGGGANTSGP